jgi:hypothetical protein
VREGLEKSRSASTATGLTSLVVLPGAREAFTSRELVCAYEDFLGGEEPLYRDEASGLKATAYRLGERVLFVYQEAGEASVIGIIHPTS